MSDAPVVLEAQAVTRVFDTEAERLEVLSGVDLRMTKGELVAIMGPSGTGKSTLLHILGGLDRPTTGRVLLDGVDIFSYPAARLPGLRNRKVGFVFQFHHLLFEFTVLENVALPLLIGGTPEREAFARAHAVLEEIGFTSRLKHRPFQLSGGEKSKVAVARALVNDPAVVMADEPTGNLDVTSAGLLMDLMGGLNRKREVTMVLVTHNRAVADRASRRLVMRDGRLESEEPEDL